MPVIEDFVLCEDARLEAGGLLTLVGFFPGALRVAAPGNTRVVCLLVLRQMTGIERFLMQVEVSLGKQTLYKSGVIECRRQPQPDNHTIVHAISPFPVPEAGKYLFRVTVEMGVNATHFTKTLDIDMAPLPAPAGGKAPA